MDLLKLKQCRSCPNARQRSRYPTPLKASLGRRGVVWSPFCNIISGC